MEHRAHGCPPPAMVKDAAVDSILIKDVQATVNRRRGRNSMRKGVSPLYALVKTVEFDVVLGDDSFALRVELFQDKTRSQTFRANIWRNELYRIQSTFPQNPSTGRPEHPPPDQPLPSASSPNLPANYTSYT